MKYVWLACLLCVCAVASAQNRSVEKVKSQCIFYDEFIDNKDGTVTDPRNGLVWKRCAEGQSWTGNACDGNAIKLNLSDALKLAQESRFLDKETWRLPNKSEFEMVLGKRCENNDWKSGEYAASAMLANPIKANGSVGKFWTPQTHVGKYDSMLCGKEVAYVARFFDGNLSADYNFAKCDGSNVRLVRSGTAEEQAAMNKTLAATRQGQDGKLALAPQREMESTGGRFDEKSVDSGEYVDTDTGLVWRRCPIGSNFNAGGCTSADSREKKTMSARIRESDLFKMGWRLPSSSEITSLITRLSGVSYRSGDYAYGRNECNTIKTSVSRIFPANDWVGSRWDSDGTIPYYSVKDLREEGKIRTHRLYTTLSYYGQCGISDSGGFYQHEEPKYINPIIVVRGNEASEEWTTFLSMIKGSQKNITVASSASKDRDLDRAINNTALGRVAKGLVEVQQNPVSNSKENSSESRSKITGILNQATRPHWSKRNHTFECIAGRNQGYKGIVDRRDSGMWSAEASLIRYKTPIEAAEAECPQ